MGNTTSGVAELKHKSDISGMAERYRQGGGMGDRRGMIGKQVSSKRFKRDDPFSAQWKIFNDLDVQDDKLMLELAVFLQRLIHSFPSKEGEAGASSKKSGAEVLEADPETDAAEGEEEGGGSDASGLAAGVGGITLDSIRVSEAPVPSLVRIGSVDVRLGAEQMNDNLMDYSLPKAAPTMDTVQEVVHLFASGGKLSLKSVRRILRDAYKVLKELPNVMYLNLEQDESITVVGDLHGQLPDLVELATHNGLPSSKNKYIFNGDFVDRGSQGVEVLIVLFLLLTVEPHSVVLNRGNHEDFGLCCVYGFQKECLAKYNDVIFSMFCEMFRHLPVCSVIHNKVLVIHGGLFHREGVKLADLERVDRLDYVVPSRQDEEGAEDLAALSEEEKRTKDLRTLMHCALWSDPDLEPSLPTPQPNPRGAGVLFGPDMTRSFLEDNGLDMVVRSHECVEEGFDLPYEGEMEGSCATIFSASNYGGSMNQGATMRFSWTETDESFTAGGDRATEPELHYTVHDYQLSNQSGEMGENVLKANQSGLSSMVLRKKRPLMEAFSQVDKTNSGYVTKERWGMVMEKVTGLQIAWMPLVDLLVNPEDVYGDKVQWSNFMAKFHVQVAQGAKQIDEGGGLFDAVYSNREKLEAIFRFFDQDGNGVITRDEFSRGCEMINKELPPGEKLENAEGILALMDFDRDDQVDINEFFEAFRLTSLTSVKPASSTT